MAGENNYLRIPPDSTGKRIRVKHTAQITYSNKLPGHTWNINEHYNVGAGWEIHIHGFYESSSTTGILEVHYSKDSTYGNVSPAVGDTIVLSETNTVVATIVSSNDVFVNTNHIVGHNNPEFGLNIDRYGSAGVRFAEGQPIMSGFGNLKVSNQRVLGVYESSMDTYDDLFSVQITGSGESEFQPNVASVVLRVDGQNSTRVCRTTNRYHYYLPGTSNYVIMTIACGDTGKTGNIRRWGAFDDNDGVFFELNNTTMNVVVRSTTSGSLVETKIPQHDWNYDTVDGNSSSGHILDITKINIWWIDYQWLGAGRVRFGIVLPDGSRLVCHQVQNAGQHPLPYMRTGTLPLRTENVNTSATGVTTELREVCMAVYCEGTYEDYTFWRNVTNHETPITIDTQHKLLVAMKAKQTINGIYNGIQSYPEALNIYATQPVAVNIWQNVSLTNTGTWTESAGSVDYVHTGTVNVSNAFRFHTIYADAGAHYYHLRELFEVNDEGIQATVDGSPQIWAITANNLSASTATVTANVCLKELW